ncbi:MAG: HK97 family phage prohead protease [Chloroherpetonaceae bacterium]|nr:HK97 family phage prohead protease [Chloroherpetonaceae bacterium]
MLDDTCVLYGGEVKWSGETADTGTVSGYLVLFGSAEMPDASPWRDFFTPETDFDLDVSSRRPVYYNHGLDIKMGDQRIGVGEISRKDDVGLWIEAQLNLRDAYVEAIRDMARKGELGWSSGAVAHLVRRRKEAKNTHRVLHWPIGEASLTPAPAEPRTMLHIKSLPGIQDRRHTRFLIERQVQERGGELLEVLEQRVFWREGDVVKVAPVVDQEGWVQIDFSQESPVRRSIVYQDAVQIPYTPEEAQRLLRDAGFVPEAADIMVKTYAAWQQQKKSDEREQLQQSLQAQYARVMARALLLCGEDVARKG